MHGPNVIVLNDSGKPIFCRYGNEEEDISQITALIQTIVSSDATQSVVTDSWDNHGRNTSTIQCIRTNQTQVMFLIEQSLTLVAVSTGQETDVFLQFILELVYQHFVFLLTDQFQSILSLRSDWDLRDALGLSGENTLRALLERALPSTNCPSFTLAGIEVVFPIPFQIREQATKVLAQVCENIPNTVLGILCIGSKLITIAFCRLPHQDGHCLHTSDLLLLLEFVGYQSSPSTTTQHFYTDRWFPICLPRFYSSGFLHTYVSSLVDSEQESNVTLVFLSTIALSSQFDLFRKAALEIRQLLGFRTSDRVPDASSLTNVDSHVSALRTDNSLPSEAMTSLRNLFFSQEFRAENNLASFLSTIHNTQYLHDYCKIASACHFAFRYDCSWERAATEKEFLLQTMASDFDEAKSKDELHLHHIWSTYQHLSLRLRFGSSSIESTFLASSKQQQNTTSNNQNIGSRSLLSSHILLQTPPSKPRETFTIDKNGYLFIGLCDRNFELYATLPIGTPPSKGLSDGLLLARSLLKDKDDLFCTRPRRFRAA